MCTLTFVDPSEVDERAFSYAVRIRKPGAYHTWEIYSFAKRAN